MVAPYLPRVGVKYIPRPALGVVMSGTSAAAVFTVNNITVGQGAFNATLRVDDQLTGAKISERVASGSNVASLAFPAVALPAGTPVNVVALTNKGQVGHLLGVSPLLLEDPPAPPPAPPAPEPEE